MKADTEFYDPLDITQWRRVPDPRVLDAIDAYFASALPWEKMVKELDEFKKRCNNYQEIR